MPGTDTNSRVVQLRLHKRLADLTVCDALAIWRAWTVDVPFCGTTGDDVLDRRLADAFRAILLRATLDERLRFIEGEVWSPDDFPHPASPTDRYRETLMRWWLDLYHEGTPS